MPQTATSTPSPTFAGMLAALADPGQKRPPVRDLDGLEDDVATLSYERALRAHARYRAPEAMDRSLTSPPPADNPRIFEVRPAVEQSVVPPAGEMPIALATPLSSVEEPEAVQEFSTAAERNLKSASITIRLSRVECAQLRKRAAEAGLTVSAYLRSCTFEAESLRALVKDTLAQLRSQKSTAEQTGAIAHGSLWRRWFVRFWPPTRSRQNALQS
jgi:predicted DNA binding CopG/RHH family protein